jgi:hypothetical protein
MSWPTSLPYELANQPSIDFEAIVQIFNEGQMSKH